MGIGHSLIYNLVQLGGSTPAQQYRISKLLQLFYVELQPVLAALAELLFAPLARFAESSDRKLVKKIEVLVVPFVEVLAVGDDGIFIVGPYRPYLW